MRRDHEPLDSLDDEPDDEPEDEQHDSAATGENLWEFEEDEEAEPEPCDFWFEHDGHDED